MPGIQIYDIPESFCIPGSKTNVISLIGIIGPVESIAIPSREFKMEINGHVIDIMSVNGVIHMGDIRANIPDGVLCGMTVRMQGLGYSDESIDGLLIFSMLNHVRVIFQGGARDCGQAYVILQKKLAFFTTPRFRLAPCFNGAIPNSTFDYECKVAIQLRYNEKRVWDEGVKQKALYEQYIESNIQ